MTRAQLISAVKVKLEELTPFAEGLVVLASESDVKPITSYIDVTLDEASDEMLMLLPLHLLTPTIIPAAMAGAAGIGYLVLPADYLRLYALKVDTWAREVNRPISTDNPEYKLQSNPHTRGKSQKPIVAINYTAGAGRRLECYSVEAGTPVVEKKLYIKKIVAEDNPENLAIYLIYLCAIKVYGIIERADMAKVLAEELSNLIKIQTL